MRYYDHMDGWGPGAWLVMVLLMVLLVGALVALVVWLVRTTNGPAKSSSEVPSSAEQLLAERFARGDIDEEEFTRRRALLRAGPGK